MDGFVEQLTAWPEGLGDRAAGQNAPDEADIAHAINTDTVCVAQAGHTEAANAGQAHAQTVVVCTRHADGAHRDAVGRGHRAVDVHMLTGFDQHGRARTRPGDALSANAATSHHAADDLDILPALDGDGGASAAGCQGGGGLNIDTDAFQGMAGTAVSTVEVGLAIKAVATEHGEIAGDFGAAFPIHP